MYINKGEYKVKCVLFNSILLVQNYNCLKPYLLVSQNYLINGFW